MQKHSTIDPKILYYNSNGSGKKFSAHKKQHII